MWALQDPFAARPVMLQGRFHPTLALHTATLLLCTWCCCCRLVVHTMPVEIAVKERPQQLSSNKSQLKCGSIFFWRGLQHEDGHHVPNAGGIALYVPCCACTVATVTWAAGVKCTSNALS